MYFHNKTTNRTRISNTVRLLAQFAMAATAEGYRNSRQSRLVADSDRQKVYRQLVRANQG